MNNSQVNLSIAQVAQTFLNRFQVLPQHCPCALKLGFTHIVRFVSYDPRTPFCVCERGFPFTSEDEAKWYCQIQIKHAVDRISKFPEEERERFASVMLRDDGKGNYTVHPTYDALLTKYLPELLLGLNPNSSKPLPTPTSSITELDQFSSKIASESLDVLAKLDGQFMMQELASISRDRYYINHLEACVSWKWFCRAYAFTRKP